MTKRSKIVWAVVLAIVVFLGIAFWINAKKSEESGKPRTTKVERKTVVQEVSFTGDLQSQKKADLSFEVSGTVTNILVDTGDQVSKGQLLAKLDSRSASLELAKASANLSSSQEEAQIAFKKAETDYENLKNQNQQTLAKYRQSVLDAKNSLIQAQDILEQVNKESGKNSSIAKTSASSVLSAQASYNAARKAQSEAVEAANKNLEAANYAVLAARSQYLSTTKASENSEGLSVLQAAKELASISLSKTELRAPFSGVITQKNINIGEIASLAAPAFTLQTADSLEIVAQVPETDAVKLAVDQNATITFDAFPPTEKWEAKIASISPAAKVLEGIPTYEVKLNVSDNLTKLKPGLTTNVTVHAAEKENVLSLPRRAVITRDNKQVVQIAGENGETAEKEIITGLAGSDGTVEIVSGLNEGDEVVIPSE